MSYSDYLKNTLKPLGIYELDTGFGSAELNVEGAVMDEIDGVLSSTLRNMLPMTADAEGLSQWEKLFPRMPEAAGLAERRTALMAMIRMGECECSDQGLNHVLQACGIPANVSETNVNQTVKVTILEDFDEAGLKRTKECIEAILPCHLAITYA